MTIDTASGVAVKPPNARFSMPDNASSMTAATSESPESPQLHHGVIVSVRGSVVDVRLDEQLPSIYSVLRAGSDGAIVIEVLAQSDAHHVRCIALTPTAGLARGMSATDTGMLEIGADEQTS